MDREKNVDPLVAMQQELCDIEKRLIMVKKQSTSDLAHVII